jgi:hypothetical protein
MNLKVYIWFLIIYGLIGCQSRLYDDTTLRMQVVHNPKNPTIYGIVLATELNEPVQIEKVTLGNVVKKYGSNCEKPVQRLDPIRSYEHCVLNNSLSKFQMICEQPQPLTCEVYYTVKGIKKKNHTQSVHTIDCTIGYSSTPGIPMPPDTLRKTECIWDIGHILYD